ncbi:DUF5753 domain-containing protein [Saccharothrix longispora]|uniref:DUF5753 domain-containing protein n=1 Tax=Saccharothrix longispora TaxID=33920 RepID=A0ABU1PY32_9PSEU|nr:DUF5753 domain-containing protein [Saccharothrix longispora]MDR6595059.1 hypothetical protein [Saccharothrix longispora]
MEPRASNALSRELGDALRRARRRSAVKVGVLVEELGWSVAKISKLEHGTRGASLPDIARYAGRLHADQPTYDHIMSLAQAQNTGHVVRSHEIAMPDNLRALLLHEQTAEVIWSYQIALVPGLLQTEGYARALMTADAEHRVAERMARQGIFERLRPPEGRFFVLEPALHHVVGGPQVMYEQVLRLLFRGGVRVVPFADQLPASLTSAFTFMTFAEHPPVSYVEAGPVSLLSDEAETTERFRQACDDLDRVALGEEQSWSVFAAWVDRYDRLREERRGAGGGAVA